MTRPAGLRGDVPPEIPDDIDDPGVEKARGVVTLPRRVKQAAGLAPRRLQFFDGRTLSHDG